MNSAMPFIFYGETKANEFTNKINLWLKDFYIGWFSSNHGFHYQITVKNKKIIIDHNQWEFYGNSNRSWIAFKKDLKCKQNIISAFFDMESLNSFKSTNFTDAIYDDFIQSNLISIFDFANISDPQVNPIENVDTSFGSGALTGLISNNQVTLTIAFGGDFVKAICGNDHMRIEATDGLQNLISRADSIDFLKAKIEVLAGNVELTLSDFNKMETGDIILLDSKVGGLFSANLSKDKVLSVQLGKLTDKKAIQFVERAHEKSR